LHLKTLELTGFKSFAERVSLNFGAGLNAVVGPNGSGKSNIADAIRWVLGEQSAKQLRGYKMEDVIFSGTAHRKPLGFAEIVMRIDNSDGTLSIGTPEVTVTRRVYRSGESEYALNGTPCRLKDIQQLFMDTGVGRDGYSIIGQGRVDEILSVRSEDRRHIFEEAAGISKFKARRTEALHKLTRERTNRDRVTDIITELNEQLSPLEQQSEEARRYLSLRDQYKQTYINIFLNEVRKNEIELEKIEETLTNTLTQSADGRARLTLAREAEETLKTQAAEADLRYRNTSDALLETTTAIAEKEGERNLLENQTNTLIAEKIRLLGEVDKRNAATAEKTAERGLAEDIRDKAAASLENLQAELAKHQDRSVLYETAEEESAAELAAYNQEILNQGNLITEHKAKVLDAENRYRRLEEEKEKLNITIEQLEENIESQEEALDRLQKTLTIRTNEKNQTSQQVTAYTQALAVLNTDKQTIEKDYQKAQESLTATRAKHRAIADLQNQHEGYYRSVQAILRERETNPLFSGIKGAVGELVGVPVEYEIAVETALGSAAQHIVTQTEEDAKHAIEYLKQTQKGRATFLPLSAVKGRLIDTKPLTNETGFLGLAAGLVNYDAVYTHIIHQLLGDIIVMDNLNNATALHKKFKYSYKLVTLQGERLSPGGAMTGGSIQRLTGGIIGRPRQLTELGEQIQILEKTFDQISKTKISQSQKYEAAEEALHRIRTREQSLILEVQKLTDQNTLIEEGLKTLHKSHHQYNAENDTLMAQLVETNQTIRQAKQAQSEQEQKQQAAHTRLEEYQTNLIQKRQLHHEESDVRTELRVEISRQTEWQATATTNIERLLHETAVLSEEKRVLLQEIEKVQKNTQQTEEKRTQITDALNVLKICLEETRAAQATAEAHKTQLDDAINRVTADERHQSDETSLIEKELTRLEMRKEQLTQNSHRLHNEIWEEYELTYQQALPHKRTDISETNLRREYQHLKTELAAYSDVNIGAIEAYKQIKTRHDFLSAQHDDILKAEEALNELITTLTAHMEEQFLSQFSLIAFHFNEVFREMFGGGVASLRISDTENPLESGIEITAQPPGKTLQTLLLLSGGERALTAIALLFAILRLKPSPFCVLDEIESALDDANVTRFSQFLKQYTEGTQFIIITHRKGTMEAADHLYGVTMQEQGVSKLVSVRFTDDFENHK
jgi:chromosome segregation protein